jgi:very-short-patch-repair endonuclease
VERGRRQRKAGVDGMWRAGHDGAERSDRASTRDTLETARRFRRELTPPERIMWERLRDKRLDGAKFRRQHPVGPYVLDFYCPAAHLAVEVDGGSHEGTAEADSVRDAWLAEHGVHVVRIPASVVFTNLAQALEPVRQALRERLPTHPC